MKAEEKSQKAEKKILDAALKVVKDNTISGTRMHLIAEKADMVQSNLHYYFKTKDDLMNRLQEQVLSKCLEIRDVLKNDSEDSLEGQLDVFIGQKIDFLRNNQEYDFAEIDFWVQGRINDKMKENFAASFAGWRKDIAKMIDKYVPELSDEKKKYLPHIIVSLLEGATLQYLTDEESMDVDEYFKTVKEIIINTINSYK